MTDILLQQEEQRRQFVRMELARELNLALAALFILGTFTSMDHMRTQLLFLETILCGWRAWDAWTLGQEAKGVVPFLLLALLATVGLFLQASHDLVASLNVNENDELLDPELLRNKFDKLPEDIHDLMQESAHALTKDGSSKQFAFLLPGEDEIVTAFVVKPDVSSTVGITLVKLVNNWRFIITQISPDGLLADSGLQVGQTILSINGVSTAELKTAKDATALMKQTPGQLTIVATTSLYVRVQKPTPNAKCGFSFARVVANNDLILHRIHDTSILQSTVAQEGMKVLAINHQPAPSSLAQAAELVKESVSEVSLILVRLEEEETMMEEDDTTAGTTKSTRSVVSKSPAKETLAWSLSQ